MKALEDRGSKLDWEPPLYEETAKSWLESPEAVPVPIRVDAAILPKFPTIPDAGIRCVEPAGERGTRIA